MFKRRKQIILILIIYLLINRCNATGLLKTAGGRTVAMGRTSVCEQSLWALTNNPAGLASLQGWNFGLYYENQWMLKETAFKNGSIAKAFEDIGCFGLTVSQFGWSGHSENLLGLAYARSFGPYLEMGLRADCWWLHMGESYRDRFAPGFMLGIQSQVTEKLRLGATIINPINSSLKTLNEDALPIVMRIGCAYRFTEDFIGQCEVEKDSQTQGLHIGGGFEYTLFERFQLRAGAQYNPNIISFGAGYVIRNLQVDVAAQMHQALGASVQVSLNYNLERRKPSTKLI